jgi:hypothetical protein
MNFRPFFFHGKALEDADREAEAFTHRISPEASYILRYLQTRITISAPMSIMLGSTARIFNAVGCHWRYLGDSKDLLHT